MPRTNKLVSYFIALMFMIFLEVIVAAKINAQPMEIAPFGIARGTPIAAMTVLKQSGPRFFYIAPPKPDPDFRTYTAVADNRAGVCNIMAYTQHHNNDEFGEQALSRIEEMSEKLNALYGPGKLHNFLNLDSTLSNPIQWAYSIHRAERSYFYSWVNGQKSKLPPGGRSVILSVGAIDQAKTLVMVSYTFDNMDRCLVEK